MFRSTCSIVVLACATLWASGPSTDKSLNATKIVCFDAPSGAYRVAVSPDEKLILMMDHRPIPAGVYGARSESRLYVYDIGRKLLSDPYDLDDGYAGIEFTDDSKTAIISYYTGAKECRVELATMTREVRKLKEDKQFSKSDRWLSPYGKASVGYDKNRRVCSIQVENDSAYSVQPIATDDPRMDAVWFVGFRKGNGEIAWASTLSESTGDSSTKRVGCAFTLLDVKTQQLRSALIDDQNPAAMHLRGTDGMLFITQNIRTYQSNPLAYTVWRIAK